MVSGGGGWCYVVAGGGIAEGVRNCMGNGWILIGEWRTVFIGSQ